MWKTIARRFLILIPQLLILSLFIFILANFMPGDALTGNIDPNTSPARLEELRQKFGYYDPWYVKYGRWLSGLVKGDLGTSTSHKIPVSRLIAEKSVNTFWLSLLTVIIMYLISIPMGVVAGRHHDKIPDKIIGFYTYLSLAMPTVVFALITLLTFGFKLKWFPIRGSVDVSAVQGTWQYFLSKIHHLILPSVTGALLSTVGTIQYLRSEIVNFEVSDFVVTAKSKGVPRRKIYSRHILRNSILPVASFVGYDVAMLLAGSIFIERIFSYPGMGNLFIESILRRDFAVVNALVILYAALTVLGTIISDIVITIVDPRIRIK